MTFSMCLSYQRKTLPAYDQQRKRILKIANPSSLDLWLSVKMHLSKMFSFLCRSATAQSSWRGLCLSPKSKLQRKSSLFQKIFNLWENIPSFRKYSLFQKIFTFSGKVHSFKKHCFRSWNLERKFATNFDSRLKHIFETNMECHKKSYILEAHLMTHTF